MEIIAYKGRPFSVFVDEFVYYYSCTATTLYCHFRNIEVESNDGSHLESLDALGPGRRIFEKCALARWRPNGDKIQCHVVSQILTNRSLNLCNNSDQTLFSNTLTFARSLGRCSYKLQAVPWRSCYSCVTVFSASVGRLHEDWVWYGCVRTICFPCLQLWPGVSIPSP